MHLRKSAASFLQEARQVHVLHGTLRLGEIVVESEALARLRQRRLYHARGHVGSLARGRLFEHGIRLGTVRLHARLHPDGHPILELRLRLRHQDHRLHLVVLGLNGLLRRLHRKESHEHIVEVGMRLGGELLVLLLFVVLLMLLLLLLDLSVHLRLAEIERWRARLLRVLFLGGRRDLERFSLGRGLVVRVLLVSRLVLGSQVRRQLVLGPHARPGSHLGRGLRRTRLLVALLGLVIGVSFRVVVLVLVLVGSCKV